MPTQVAIYPASNTDHVGLLKASGTFADGFPKGVTLHYSADRNLDRTLESLAKNDLGYHFLIDRKGVVYQTMPLTHTLWHAGKAVWNNLSPNRNHAAICLLSYGLLRAKDTRYLTWFGIEVDTKEVATRDALHWDAATSQQEESLSKLLEWFIDQGIGPGEVCAHAECCIPPGRKVDPGGVLFRSMNRIRDDLRSYRKAKNMAVG